MKTKRTSFQTLVTILAGLALWACGASPRAASAELDGDAPAQSDGDGFDPCVKQGTGCACAEPGKVIECGTIKRKVGNYEICSYGYRTCGDDKRWGECESGPTLQFEADGGAPASDEE